MSPRVNCCTSFLMLNDCFEASHGHLSHYVFENVLVGARSVYAMQNYLFLILHVFVFVLIGMATILPKLHILSAMIKEPLRNYLRTLETMMGRIIIRKLAADLRFLALGTLPLAMMMASLTKKQ